jgi:hypothetical protein
VVVQVEAEAAALAACRAVRGDVDVGPSFALRSLGDLGGLVRVAGDLEVSDNVDLGGLFLPGLVAVGGDLVIENNRQVSTVSLHRLARVGGDLIVRDNHGLVRLDLGALREVSGRLLISGHRQLDTVVLDRIERAGEIVLEDNPAWHPDEVQSLRRALDRSRPRQP